MIENPDKTSKYYLTNANLIAEFKKSQEKGRMTENFGKMIVLLTDKIASRGNFKSYTYLSDMKGTAITNICKNWQGFDINKSSNIFSYYSSYIFNSFIQYIKAEKKLMNIKNKMLCESGLNPSFSYTEENSIKRSDGSLDSKILFDPVEVFYDASSHD